MCSGIVSSLAWTLRLRAREPVHRFIIALMRHSTEINTLDVFRARSANAHPLRGMARGMLVHWKHAKEEQMTENNQHTLWVVVADAADARIYGCRLHEPPMLVEHLTHPAAHLRDRDLTSDRPGRMARDVGGPQSLAPTHKASDTERDRFARTLADAIDRGHGAKRFDELALVMAPELLGLVRSHLTKTTRNSIVVTLDKRLNDTPVNDIVLRIANARSDARP